MAKEKAHLLLDWWGSDVEELDTEELRLRDNIPCGSDLVVVVVVKGPAVEKKELCNQGGAG
jgi:hypothetical protein